MGKHGELEEFLEILKIRLEVEEAYAKGMDLIANKINKYQEKYQEYVDFFIKTLNFLFFKRKIKYFIFYSLHFI